VKHLLVALGIVGVWSGTLPAQAPRQFDVASIKRNTTGFVIGGPPPAVGGRITMNNVPVLTLVARAYSKVSLPIEIVGLPAWAQSDRFDVALQADPAATSDQLEEMWRSLLVDRMKLAAHYETKDRRGYDLVLARADGKLGPELKPSTLDCQAADPTQPPPRPSPALLSAARPGSAITPDVERELMSICRLSMNVGNTTYAGGADIIAVIRAIQLSGTIREPIEDKTGLTGLFAFKLTFAHGAPVSAGATDDAPSVFTALPEQLGLKLESATQHAQVIVIDHIEPPTEN
jgi:uncharacterized protein (TIGR03435 family)